MQTLVRAIQGGITPSDHRPNLGKQVKKEHAGPRMLLRVQPAQRVDGWVVA